MFAGGLEHVISLSMLKGQLLLSHVVIFETLTHCLFFKYSVWKSIVRCLTVGIDQLRVVLLVGDELRGRAALAHAKVAWQRVNSKSQPCKKIGRPIHAGKA
jgi:hypothetical protein